MKFSLRDLCWLLLVVAVGAGWYAHAQARSQVIVHEADLVYLVRPVKVGVEDEFFMTRGIVHKVSDKELQVDHSLPYPVSGVVIHESGQFLGVTVSDSSPVGKVRRVKLPNGSTSN